MYFVDMIFYLNHFNQHFDLVMKIMAMLGKIDKYPPDSEIGCNTQDNFVEC